MSPDADSKLQRDRTELRQAITLIVFFTIPTLISYYSTLVAFPPNQGRMDFAKGADPVLTFSVIASIGTLILIPVLLLCWLDGIGLKKLATMLANKTYDSKWYLAVALAIVPIAVAFIEYRRNIFSIGIPVSPVTTVILFQYWLSFIVGFVGNACYTCAIGSVSNPRNRLCLLAAAVLITAFLQEGFGLYVRFRYSSEDSQFLRAFMPQPLSLAGWISTFLLLFSVVSFAEVFRPSLRPLALYLLTSYLVSRFTLRIGVTYFYIETLVDLIILTSIWRIKTEGNVAFRENWHGAIRSLRNRLSAWNPETNSE